MRNKASNTRFREVPKLWHTKQSQVHPMLRQLGEGAPRASYHLPGDGRLADLKTELQELAMDARRAPERVGVAHPPDHLADLALY